MSIDYLTLFCYLARKSNILLYDKIAAANKFVCVGVYCCL